MSGGDRASTGALLPDPEGDGWGYLVYVGAAGMGAKRGADGASALYARTASGLLLVGAEVMETRHPVLRRRCELDSNSGGPGRWRGGLGMIEEEEFLAEGIGACTSDRTSGVSPVLGLEGGGPPKRLNGVRYFPGTDRELGPPSCKHTNLALGPGDTYIAWTAGGGGFGDPLDRDPASVAWDVKNEYVSARSAAEDYGVVLAPDGASDPAATLARRAELRATRDSSASSSRSPVSSGP
jgi:N-methylhydantoinase B